MNNDKPHIIGIIPARMGSSRFPGKPMSRIAGVPMIGHCYFRAAMSKTLDDVFVATCDEEMADYIRSVGGKAVMTSPSHQRASDGPAEALKHIETETGRAVDIVVMIQGDEPMLRPAMIDEAVAPMLGDPAILVTNLMAPLKDQEEHEDPNEVKVVVDRQNFALYFSREAIPSRRKGATEVPALKQVCIIPFRRDFLLQFNELESGELEIIESVDMLRCLEHGYRVKMVPTRFDVYSVDTEEDRALVESLMLTDELLVKYRAKALVENRELV